MTLAVTKYREKDIKKKEFYLPKKFCKISYTSVYKGW